MSSIEGRLNFPSREKVARVTLATLVFVAPVAGFIARKELNARRIKQESQEFAKKNRQEAIKISQNSNNSGDSGFEF